MSTSASSASAGSAASGDVPAFSWRGAIAIALLVGGAILVGCLISPYIYNALIDLGREDAKLDKLLGLRDLEFDSVTTRTILILVLLGLWPAIRIGRIPRVRFGDPGFLAVGLAIGMVSMALLMVGGLVLGAYHFEIDAELRKLSECAELVLGALLIGFFEEFLLRGLVFGTLRKATRFWLAAGIASAFFSIVHFAKPEPLVGTIFGHPDAGLELAKSMFYFGHAPWHYFPFILTLFVLGLVLCRVVERTGSLWYAVGLHAGWVFGMRLGGYLVEAVEGSQWVWLYGMSDVISKSYAALFLLLAFLLYWALPTGGPAVADGVGDTPAPVPEPLALSEIAPPEDWRV